MMHPVNVVEPSPLLRIEGSDYRMVKQFCFSAKAFLGVGKASVHRNQTVVEFLHGSGLNGTSRSRLHGGDAASW
jgi:hypothetical protein